MNDILKQLKTQDMLEYTSIPFWSWNNELDENELVAQINAFNDAGIRGFIAHARTGLKEEYLGERWFHLIEVCLDEAKKLKMNCVIYDENGWPSGFVGGKLLSNPDNLAQYLRYEVKDSFDAEAFGVYTLAEDGTATRIEGPVDGVTEYHCVYLKSSPANTDVLNPAVMDQFIAETYDKYYERFADRFGKELWGFFTDEPQYYRYETPYTRVAPPIWTERYGTDMRDGLVYLFLASPAGYEFCYRYYSLMNELYTINFYKRLNDWCNEHGCAFTGHSVEETSLQMQMWGGAACTPSYEYETVPAIDHLGRKPGANLSGKQIGSATQQLGKKHVLTETFGCAGWDATPRELRLVGDAQYVRGVNMMCQHLSSYSLKGQGKVDHPPCFSRVMTWWDDYKTFNEYFDRLGYMIANSREVTNTVVINPMYSVWLDYIRLKNGAVEEIDRKLFALGYELESRAISYHLADETIMGKYGSVADGKFVVGNCAYSNVIVPYCRTLTASTKALLEKFVAAGGHVYLYEGAPEFTEGVADDYSFLTEKLADNYDAIYAGEAIKLGLSSRAPFCYRVNDDYKMLFIVNESDVNVDVTMPEGSWAKVDLNELSAVAAEDAYVLEPGKSMIFLQDYAAGSKAPAYGEAVDITGEFVFESGSDNSLPLDHVSISYDGVSFDDPHDVHEVFDRLVLADYQGDLWVKYSFEVKDLPSRVLLRAECNDQQWFELNGQRIEMGPTSYDIFFQEAQIGDKLKVGVNELVYKVKWYQDPGVRYALFDPDATESLRNCLVYDTEIETIYLIGDFKVDDARAIVADDSLVSITDIPGSGYKYFCGSKTFGARIVAEAASAQLVLDGRYMVCGVKVNGVAVAPSVLDNVVEIPLTKGEENFIELTVTSSLRNLYGPHHLGYEPGGVSPTSFTFRTTWKDGVSPDYHEDYNTVPFGLVKVGLKYAK